MATQAVLLAALASLALAMAAGTAHGDEKKEAPAQGRSRVFALVAAVGTQLRSVQEVPSTGSHLPPYRRTRADASGDILNRLVLQSLDREVARADPGAQRILLSVTLEKDDATAGAAREDAVIRKVLGEIGKIAQRTLWDRIVVVTPAYRALERDGLGSGLFGMGLFMSTQCESDRKSCEWGFRPPSGPETTTPQGELVHANNFVAPYSYLKVWVVEAKTLAVLEQAEVFGHRKLADPLNGKFDLRDDATREFLAKSILGVIDRSVGDALQQTELAGRVDIREIREVRP